MIYSEKILRLINIANEIEEKKIKKGSQIKEILERENIPFQVIGETKINLIEYDISIPLQNECIEIKPFWDALDTILDEIS